MEFWVKIETKKKVVYSKNAVSKHGHFSHYHTTSDSYMMIYQLRCVCNTGMYFPLTEILGHILYIALSH